MARSIPHQCNPRPLAGDCKFIHHRITAYSRIFTYWEDSLLKIAITFSFT